MSTVTARERKTLLQRELQRMLDVLVRAYRPEKVLLFGSLARGEVSSWSDLDLIVVKKTPKRFLDRIDEVLRLIDPKVGVDLLVYTPEEFARLCAERPFVRDEVLRRGKVLYERDG